MLKKFLNPGKNSGSINFGLFIFRVGASALMLTHGYGKFMRIVNGEWRFSDPLGIGVEASLSLAAFGEFICPILIILGLGTRLAAIPTMITMLVAWQIAHGDDPFSSQEKSVAYLLVFTCILIMGPGKYSLDQRLFKVR